jgi:NHS family xanthosine MFS transporter
MISPVYRNTKTYHVRYPAIIMSVSDLRNPLFLRSFFPETVWDKEGDADMVAWILRLPVRAKSCFSLDDHPLCIIYGMAFDFFNISGSLFVETQSTPDIRASAQGLFMMMTNGFGAFLGSRISGIVIDKYFTLGSGEFDWTGIWFSFAGYALVVAVLFALLFRHKHLKEASGDETSLPSRFLSRRLFLSNCKIKCFFIEKQSVQPGQICRVFWICFRQPYFYKRMIIGHFERLHLRVSWHT